MQGFVKGESESLLWGLLACVSLKLKVWAIACMVEKNFYC